MSEQAESDSWYWEKRWASFRKGTASIRLEWDAGSARATVYDVGVPVTATAILGALPLVVPVVHAAWSGDMLMSTRPYEIDARKFENEVRLVRPGDLTWDPKFGELAFTYGTAECRLPTGPNTLVVYGCIDSNELDGFANFCRRRRFEGVGELRMART